jgi:DNA-binding MarR family transcriptional regulator
MLSGRNKSLKPQDILILIKIVCLGEKSFRIIDLSFELNISPGEITMALERLRLSGLLASDKRKPNRASILEFLVHGLKYVFPAELGPIQRGVATGYSAAALTQKIVSDSLYVWPSEEGNTKGTAVSPLYESVAFAALKDPKLHRLMALIDTIRIGRVREKVMAIEQLNKEFAK